MATKKTKSKRTAKTSAKTSKASASANKASTSSYTNPYASAFNSNDAQNYMKNFMSSWNTNSANFDPANMQQMAAALMNTSQKNIETLTACTQIAVERVKDMMEQQASFASRMMQETASTVQEAFNGASEPRQKMEEIADYTKYCVEKTAAHARKTAEENIQIAQQIGETLNQRISESFEEIRSAA